jgi:hypothetical protein
MKIRPLKSRIEYINSLELATHKIAEPLGKRITLGPEGKTAFVDSASTVSFVQNVPLQTTQDVLNSTLLAQLAANKQFDRERETEAWYGLYRDVLSNVGWVAQSFAFSRFNSADTTLRLDKVVISILRAVLSGNELALLEDTLEALIAPQNEPQLDLFDSQSSQNEGGNFQLGTVTADPGGNSVMSLGSYYFHSTEHQRRFLWVEWESASINFWTSAQKIVLNETIYGTVRQAVIDKLGDSANRFISGIEI